MTLPRTFVPSIARGPARSCSSGYPPICSSPTVARVTRLNLDTSDGVLKRRRERYQGKQQITVVRRPLDIEKNLAAYQPPTPLPDLEEVRRLIPPPNIPREVPAVEVILEDFIRQPIE